MTWNCAKECKEVAARVEPALRAPSFIHVVKNGRKWTLELHDKRWPHWNDLYVHCRKIGIDPAIVLEKLRAKFSVPQFPEAVQEFINMTSKEAA